MTSPSILGTADGTILVHCPPTGRVASGRSLDHAVNRLSRVRPAHTHEENPS